MRKKHFLIVLSLLFIFSCTREYSTEANNRIEDNTNAWVGKVNFQEMENFIQKNTKKQIPNYLKLHNLGKRTEQYITDIDTTDIIKVVHDSITSFTIKVNTLSDKDFTFSNLVINVKNNKIEEYIYHYKPEAQWLRAYIAGEENNYEGVLKITDIDGNDTRKTYSRQASTPTTCMVYIHEPCYGSGCPCTDYNGVTYYMAATCGGGGGDGNSGDYPSGELSGGGGGTVPSVPTSEQINSFIAFLSPSIHAYITQNTNTLTDINNYFIQNGLSPKHQSFITSILEYVERKDIAWFTFSSTFNSAVAYKKQYPDNWIKISTIQDFAFDFMLQNPNTSWTQFQNWFVEGQLDYTNAEEVMFASNLSKVMNDINTYQANDTLSQLNTNWPNWNKITETMKTLVKTSAPLAVKFGKVLFKTLSPLNQNDYSRNFINGHIDAMRYSIDALGVINYNTNTMQWKDIVLCWLFELGNFPINNSTGLGTMPTLGFSGTDYVISGNPNNNMRHLSNHKLVNGIPDKNSIMFLRNIVIERIKQNNLSTVNGEWVFGTDATVDTIIKQDMMQFCLGSYNTDVYIRALGNSQYELTFIVKNKTGWQSGTRGLNDYNNDPTNDSSLGDKPRGVGIHLGGTIGETFGWKETITVR